MELRTDNFCPLLQKHCIQLQCAWFTQIQGTNPQTGKPIEEWACSVTLLPLLLIENSQQQRQTGAAIESCRNESIKGSILIAQTITRNLIEDKKQ